MPNETYLPPLLGSPKKIPNERNFKTTGFGHIKLQIQGLRNDCYKMLERIVSLEEKILYLEGQVVGDKQNRKDFYIKEFLTKQKKREIIKNNGGLLPYIEEFKPAVRDWCAGFKKDYNLNVCVEDFERVASEVSI